MSKKEKKIIVDENKVNKFKPGLMSVSKSIKRIVNLKKKSDLIPNVRDLKNLYKVLNYLEK